MPGIAGVLASDWVLISLIDCLGSRITVAMAFRGARASRLLAGLSWLAACSGLGCDDGQSSTAEAPAHGGAGMGGAMSSGGAAAGNSSSGASGGSIPASAGATTGGAVGHGGAPGGAGGASAGGGSSSGGAATGGNSSAGATSGGATGKGGLLAFPGAQGFGRLAVGARGKDVYHVTHLGDSGAGSLRDAISQPNRTVVFDVGGVIKLSSRLVFKNNQTIAGQTAPGGGITVYGDGTSFSAASNTIVRYMRFRMGKIGESEKDTVTIANGHDIIFDHCSMSWGRDGTFDLNQESGSTLYNITLQDSIVAQGLQTHSTGGLVNTTGTSIIRSLYIDNNSRNPKASGTLQFVNNVVYDWVVSGYILGDTSGRSDGYMVGNYFIPGPETHGGTLDSPTTAYQLFASGNFYDSDKNGALNGRPLEKGDFGTVTWEVAPSASFPSVPELSAQQALEHVRAHAGASLWRDPVDDYVIDELMSFGKKGKTINDETSLGIPNVVGDVAAGTAPKDTDRDGMPDAWEQSNGLDVNNAADRNGERNDDGWTNLDEYINSLAM